MNIITEQQRIERYRSASLEIRDLYASDVLTEHVDALYTKYGITKPFRDFSGIIGDTILGFNRISDIPKLFEEQLGITVEQSQRMTSELIEFLAPVVEREKAEGSTKKEELRALAQTFAQPAPERLPNTEVRALAENVEPLRTMEGDINRIHGYGAYQENQQAESETITTDAELPKN